MDERRTRPRVDLSITATLMSRDRPVGRYTVQNLSAAGALLTGAHRVDPDEPCWLLLDLPDRPISVGARVRRQVDTGAVVAIAVELVHVSEASEDLIQDAVLGLLDSRFRREHPAVLVVDPDASRREVLRQSLQRGGRRAIECEAPLSAMQALSDPHEHIYAVVMRDGPGAHPELLQWVAETRSDVRPILVIEDRKSDPAVSHHGVRRCFPEHLDEHLR